MTNSSPILVIDENEEEAINTCRALADAKVPNEPIHVLNGQAALDHLSNNVNPNPALILLDPKSKDNSGGVFLKERIKNDSLIIIPVVILTGHDNLVSESESVKYNIAGYMHKPSDYAEMVVLMQAIHQYWSFSEMAQHD